MKLCSSSGAVKHMKSLSIMSRKPSFLRSQHGNCLPAQRSSPAHGAQSRTKHWPKTPRPHERHVHRPLILKCRCIKQMYILSLSITITSDRRTTSYKEQTQQTLASCDVTRRSDCAAAHEVEHKSLTDALTRHDQQMSVTCLM